MSRLADYFVIVGYDHEKESMYIHIEISSIFLNIKLRFILREWDKQWDDSAAISRKRLE